MSQYFWIATGGTPADPLSGSSWMKSDGTTGVYPTTGDDAFIQAIAGLTLAPIWASGTNAIASPGSLATSGGATTGGHLAQSTSYYYYVTAITAAGESLVSAELTYTIGATGTATNTVTVNWAAVAGATGYKIYRATTSGAEQYLATVGAVTSYADTSATVPAGNPPGAAFTTLNSLTISQTFTAAIGAAGFGGYWQIGATTWTIGTPTADGSTANGSGRIKLDFGSIAFTGTVINTGTSIDTGYEPVRIKGTNSGNVLYALGGRVGVATNSPGETANLSGSLSVTGTGTVVDLGAGVTWATANVTSGATLNTNSAGTTLNNASGATVNTNGAVAITTINNYGTANLKHRAAPLATTINAYAGGTVDFSGNPATGTVTTINKYAGATIKRSAANPAHVTFGTSNTILAGTETITA